MPGWTAISPAKDRILRKSGWPPKEHPSEIRLAPEGTPFQRQVWDELLKIPYGTTDTYGAIARRLHSGSQAVGGAVGRNPISIIIPCHRVLGTDGSLTGYAAGLAVKEKLLEIEGCM